jgi:hypothetical protein
VRPLWLCLLGLFLLVAACKPPLKIDATYRVEPKGVRVDVRTVKGAEIHAPGETRTAQSEREVFLVRFDQLSEGGSDKLARFEVHRGNEVETLNVLIPVSKLPAELPAEK